MSNIPMRIGGELACSNYNFVHKLVDAKYADVMFRCRRSQMVMLVVIMHFESARTPRQGDIVASSRANM